MVSTRQKEKNQCAHVLPRKINVDAKQTKGKNQNSGLWTLD